MEYETIITIIVVLVLTCVLTPAIHSRIESNELLTNCGHMVSKCAWGCIEAEGEGHYDINYVEGECVCSCTNGDGDGFILDDMSSVDTHGFK